MHRMKNCLGLTPLTPKRDMSAHSYCRAAHWLRDQYLTESSSCRCQPPIWWFIASAGGGVQDHVPHQTWRQTGQGPENRELQITELQQLITQTCLLSLKLSHPPETWDSTTISTLKQSSSGGVWMSVAGWGSSAVGGCDTLKLTLQTRPHRAVIRAERKSAAQQQRWHLCRHGISLRCDR